MKTLNKYIIESLKIGSKTKVKNYSCNPKDGQELRDIIRERLENDKNANLNDIDVSDITNMYNLFYNLDPYNIDISKWNVSNVTDMGYMFFKCENFNSNLNNWDVSNVKNMENMFKGCRSLKNKPSWYKE